MNTQEKALVRAYGRAYADHVRRYPNIAEMTFDETRGTFDEVFAIENALWHIVKPDLDRQEYLEEVGVRYGQRFLLGRMVPA